MRYFDYEKMAKKAKIPENKLADLKRVVRQEFPKDDMMYELHLLRVCIAIRDNRLSLEEALLPEPVSPSS